MRLQMLPSTIDPDGRASQRQHLPTIIIDDRLAIDAGCLAFSCTDAQRAGVRNIVLSHTHLDHIAGLPMFIDDLFRDLTEPVRVHATCEMIETLERDIFNWSTYPKFSDLSNDSGKVLEYVEFEAGSTFQVDSYLVRSVPVNHQVAACGYLISDADCTVAISGDTAETDDFWNACAEISNLKAVFVECAFPDAMSELASVSCHLTPSSFARELQKVKLNCPIFAINLKPMYRDQVVRELDELGIAALSIAEVGRVYEF